VNDYDLVESFPGANCDCTGPERNQFVTRAKQLWEVEKEETRAETTERLRRSQLQAERNLATLCEMFPLLDKSLISSLYCELRQDMNSTVEQCMALVASMEGTTEAAASSSSADQQEAPVVVEAEQTDADFFSTAARQKRRDEMITANDPRNWPSLTTANQPKAAEGFGLCEKEVELKDLELADESESDEEDKANASKSRNKAPSWKDVAAAAADLPAPRKSLNCHEQTSLWNYDYDGGNENTSKRLCAEEEFKDYERRPRVMDEWELNRSRGQARRDKQALYGRYVATSSSCKAAAAQKAGSDEDEEDEDTEADEGVAVGAY